MGMIHDRRPLDALTHARVPLVRLYDEERLDLVEHITRHALRVSLADRHQHTHDVNRQSWLDHVSWLRAIRRERRWRRQHGIAHHAPTLRFDRGYLDDLKRQLPLVEEIGVVIDLRRAGRTFVGLCPFHDDHNPSLTVYPESNSWWCFGCNVGGDLFDWLAAFQHGQWSFRACVEYAAARAGVARPQPERPKPGRPGAFEVIGGRVVPR